MYNIPYFKANTDQEVLAFMKAHPFITLCGIDANSRPVATHVPVLFAERDGKLFLQAHIMRKQNHTEAFLQNSAVLAIFQGAHTYISATLYQPTNVASTWNYQAVHAAGTIHFLDDAALYDFLVRLTEHFESNPHSPALVQHMDEGYVKGLMKAIIAFEIEVTDIQHVFKLSQNKDKKVKQNIINHLSDGTSDDKAVAAAMQNK
jgi:transcriptional regulator